MARKKVSASDYPPDEEARVEGGITELEELKLPTPGERYKARIRRILKGRIKDFVDIDRIRDERIRERFENIKERQAVQIEYEVDGALYRQTFLVSNSSNSNYRKLLLKYRRLKVGDEIEVYVDDKGRLKILV